MLPFGIASHCIGLMCLAGTAPSGEIRGVVLDADSAPVRKTIVLAANSETGDIYWWNCENAHKSYGSDGMSPESPGWSGSPARSGAAMEKTDRQGRFHFTRLREGSFLLLVAHPEKGMLIARDVTSAPGGDNSLTLKLPPPTFVEGKINGYKRGKTGFWHKAQEYVALQLDGDRNFTRLSPKCPDGSFVLRFDPRSDIGADGSFRVGPLPCGGRMRLRVYRYEYGDRFQEIDYLWATLDVAEGKTTRFDYDLNSHQTINGALLDENGKPLPSAAVQLGINPYVDGHLGVWKLGAMTNDKGRFTIHGVPPGEYKLSASRMGEPSRAAKLGAVCESVLMQFKTEQELTVNAGVSPNVVIKVTEEGRERARAQNIAWFGEPPEENETIPPEKWFEPAVAPE